MEIAKFSARLQAGLSKGISNERFITDLNETEQIASAIIFEKGDNNVFSKASETLVKKNLNSRWSISRVEQFKKFSKIQTDNIFSVITVSLKNCTLLCQEMTEYFKKNKVDLKDYKSSALLQLYGIMRFYIMYSADLLLMFNYNESSVGLGDNKRAAPLTPAQIQKLERDYEAFCVFTSFFYKSKQITIDSVISKLPDIEVTEENASAIAGVMDNTKSKLFPNTINENNFIGLTNWPFVLAGHIAARQVRRFEELQCTIKSIELEQHDRTLRLEEAKSSGEPDDKMLIKTNQIEKALEYNNTRLKLLKKERLRLEEKYEL